MMQSNMYQPYFHDASNSDVRAKGGARGPRQGELVTSRRTPPPPTTACRGLRAARSRQLARLADDQKPPAPRAALAMAKSKAYQAAADAPATLRAYAADLAHFKAWCEAHGFQPMPA